MNKSLLLKVAKHIETHPSEYDQTAFCGTAFCVAAHALVLSGKRSTRDMKNFGLTELVPAEAQKALRLSPLDAKELFLGVWSCSAAFADLPSKAAKAKYAADLIRRFVRTGVIE